VSAAAIVIIMAIRHLEQRVQALEAYFGIGSDGNDLDQRFVEARQKSIAMPKQAYIDKIEKMAANYEADKAGDNSEPPESKPKDDRERFGRFDPSVGSRAQATSQHPMGDDDLVPVPSKAEYDRGKAEFEREKAEFNRAMKKDREGYERFRRTYEARTPRHSSIVRRS
jgi:hypothetical protein